MTKELVEDIMDLETEAEEQLAKAAQDKDTMIRKAHEKAMLLVQEAEHAFDSEREAAIKTQNQKLSALKKKAAEDAQKEAEALSASVQKRVPQATEYVLRRFTEHVQHDAS